MSADEETTSADRNRQLRKVCIMYASGKQRPRQGNKGREVGNADVDREGRFFCRCIHFMRKVSRRLKTENDPFLSAFFVLYGNF